MQAIEMTALFTNVATASVLTYKQAEQLWKVLGSTRKLWKAAEDANKHGFKQVYDFAVAGCYNDTCKGGDEARNVEVTYIDGMYESGGDKFEEGFYIFFAPHDTVLKFKSVKELCSVREQFDHIINQLT